MVGGSQVSSASREWELKRFALQNLRKDEEVEPPERQHGVLCWTGSCRTDFWLATWEGSCRGLELFRACQLWNSVDPSFKKLNVYRLGVY